MVRNMFKKGDIIECSFPSGEIKDLQVERIQKSNDLTEISVAHPNMNVIINQKEFPEWALIRKRL